MGRGETARPGSTLRWATRTPGALSGALSFVATAVILGLFITPAAGTTLRPEPIRPDAAVAKPFARCGVFNNIFIYGDPTDCPGDETVPLCSSERVVKAARKFLKRAHPIYRALEVTALDHVHEVTDRRFNPSPLVRRYCRARATLENGKHTTAHFFIEEDSGFVGISWSVSVCLDGYDPWRVYDGRCRVARPVTSY